MGGLTQVRAQAGGFLVNGRPLHAGVAFRGRPMDGLLLNSRMANAIFDDENPETRHLWAYPDGPWDPARHLAECLAAMPAWHAAGLDAITVSLQGGAPIAGVHRRYGRGRPQPWMVSAIAPDGTLRPPGMTRLAAVLDTADRLGLVVILNLFYFGQDARLDGEAAIGRAVDGVVDWLAARGDAHVLIDLVNEADHDLYTQPALMAPQVSGLMQRAAHRAAGRFPMGCSMRGGRLPPPAVLRAADVVYLHGNHLPGPRAVADLVAAARALPDYDDQPIVFNEDPAADLSAEENHLTAAVMAGAGWGYLDIRQPGEGFAEGFQSVPVDWSIGSARKRRFFALLREISGKPAGTAEGEAIA
jgi:hypothetical protein